MTTYTNYDFLSIRIGDLKDGIEQTMGATKFSFSWPSLQRYCKHEEEETGVTTTRDETMKCWFFLQTRFDNFLTNSFSNPFLTCYMIRIDNSKQSHTSKASSIEEASAVSKSIYFPLNKGEQLLDG